MRKLIELTIAAIEFILVMIGFVLGYIYELMAGGFRKAMNYINDKLI